MGAFGIVTIVVLAWLGYSFWTILSVFKHNKLQEKERGEQQKDDNVE